MINDFAWGLFKNTGNLDAYLIMKETEEDNDTNKNPKTILGEQKNILGGIDGDNKN